MTITVRIQLGLRKSGFAHESCVPINIEYSVAIYTDPHMYLMMVDFGWRLLWMYMKTGSERWSNQWVMTMLHLHCNVTLHIYCTCINIHRVLKNRLQALRGYSKSPSQHMSRNQCLLSFRIVLVLGKVEDPGTSVERIAATVGIGIPLVWRTLHEKSLYP
jgi:hypothetical protein